MLNNLTFNIKKLSGFFLVLFISFSTEAKLERHYFGPKVTVNSLQIVNLQEHGNKYITVMYVIGALPFYKTATNPIIIDKIKASSAAQQILSNSITVPSVEIERTGFQQAYNFIVFVIHTQPQFMWVNADGSVPIGSASVGSTKWDSILVLSKQDYENKLTIQNNSSVVIINN